MHLTEMLNLRPVPAAGLFLSLTRRCPLSCSHCSANSLLSSEEYPEDIFLRFVETFTPANRPDLVLLMGGEPLLRPKLICELAERVHAVGSQICLISGMFFARSPRVPRLIRQAMSNVDHFTASLDVFHEQQVPRAAVFRVMLDLVERGQDVSFHVVGLNENDPYLADVTGDIRRFFADRVPVFVAPINAVGRAKAWLKKQENQSQDNIEPLPCSMAAWPTVAFDGTVVACCNQAVVGGPAPPHLRLGHAAKDDWAKLRERYLTSTMMRAIRVFGPKYIASRHGFGKVGCDGYCSTCHKLAEKPDIAGRLETVMARPGMRFVEQQVVRLEQERLVADYAIPRYAALASLGYEPKEATV